jgi:acyl-CoA thioesterase-1
VVRRCVTCVAQCLLLHYFGRVTKRVYYLVTLLFFLLLGGGISCSRSPKYHNFPPAADGPWLAFGDSLTAGYGASPGKDYPTVLGKRLGLKIENHGVVGQTTAGAFGRLENAAQTRPRVVLLCLGGNDGLQGMSRDVMFQNLGKIIDRFHAEGSFVVLIGIRSTTLRDKNEEGFEKLAAQKRVLYLPDMLSGLLTDPRLMSDQIHPNDAGYEKIAERLSAELRPLLPQLK